MATISRLKRMLVLSAGFAAALSLISSSLGSGPSAHAAAASGCSLGQTQAQGTLEALAGGGSAEVFNLGGQVVTIPAPPVGFDASSASAAQLQSYGLPEKPTTSSALTEWASLVSSEAVLPLALCWQPASKNALFQAGGTSGCTVTYCSGNWSGYLDNSSSNYFKGVEGDFVQPTSNVTCSSAALGDWVGIGGIGGGLMQTGTQYAQNGTTPTTFYEWIAADGSGIKAVPYRNPPVIHPGDTIHVSVNYTPSTGATSYYIFNETTNKHMTTDVTSTSYYDGRDVEWIDERPDFNGTLAPLNHYVSNSWTNANGKNQAGTYESLTSNSEYHIEMWNGSTLLSKPNSAASGASFTDNFHTCQ